MRVAFKCTVLLLFIVIVASGWGSVLASAICLHSTGEPKRIDAMDEHSCCPADGLQQGAHCNTDGDQSSAEEVENRVHSAASTQAVNHGHGVRAVPPCGYCLLRSTPVPVFMNLREKDGTRRSSYTQPTIATRTPLARQVAFISPVAYRQGAPPHSFPAKQILYGSLLI